MPSLPLLALAGLAVVILCVISAGRTPIRSWWVPAMLSAAFFAYSLWPILTLGPLGFWPEHVSDPWSLQIWFDLLCSIGVGWALLAPRARTAGNDAVAVADADRGDGQHRPARDASAGAVSRIHHPRLNWVAARGGCRLSARRDAIAIRQLWRIARSSGLVLAADRRVFAVAAPPPANPFQAVF